jgi:hypothetical protein
LGLEDAADCFSPLFRFVCLDASLSACRASLQGITAMTRRCIIGLITALLATGPALPVLAASSEDGAACNRGDLGACTRIIDDTLAAAHDRVAASIQRGLYHRDHGDRDLALADFRQAVSLDPVNSNASLSNQCLAIAGNGDKDLSVFTYGIADSESSARETAINRCEQDAAQKGTSLKCTVVELACDGFANLPAAFRPDQGRPCTVGEKVTVSGTIQDVARRRRAWSAGTIATVDNCKGLIDPSTGFAALFGHGRPPSGCIRGRRFLAVGVTGYGFQPEFFLKVQSIKCE